MIGYIYKTTNNVTGQYYIGKREYRMDEKSPSIYLGSGARLLTNIEEYGVSNFSRTTLAECESNEEMFEIESEYIHKFCNDPLCLNDFSGSGFGGIYDVGQCKECGTYTVIYKNSGKCMKCILGDKKQAYCETCGRITYRYNDGSCMSCAANNAHSRKWCHFCQAETTHFGDKCKSHDVKLVKDGDRIELKVSRKIVFRDVKKLLAELKVHKTARSVSYELPENYMRIKCNDEFVGLKNILFNENINDWLKISYRYDGRRDHVRSITLTCDHPLPCIDGVVRRADELKVGDKLIRVNVKAVGSGKQWDFAEIISIESVDQIRRSYDVTTETGYFDINQDILSHNCRSFLTPYVDPETKKPKYYGRFNQGVVTINLPDVGLSARKMMIDKGITYVDDKQWNEIQEEFFWKIFEERLELCHRALRIRHERLLGTLSDASPIHWQNGALARLEKGEPIDKLLYGGYSTLSLGYAGLYECVKAMTGKSHTDDEAKPFALAIMQKMNDKCAEWRKAEDIAYSLYGTPIESTTYKFAKCLRKRFGIIEGVTDKDYITNSYHVHVTEHINAFDKLKFEAEFQLLSPGGAISYIETANLNDNIEAILAVMKYIYENIMYAELNTKSDYCQVCGYDGEIEIVENDDGKLIWRCPNCGNTNKSKMNIARRTCGYIGTNDWNQGRTQEIKERYVHLGGD